MAGDWIKLEHATLDKPEVLELAELLSVSQGDALLLCLRTWIWTDQQSRNGHGVRVTKTGLDTLMRCPGLANALAKVGWLSGSDGSIDFINFDRHNGKTAKERALTTKRKQTERGNNVTEVSRTDRDKSVTREEKRRDKQHSAFALPDWVPPDAWQSFEDVRKKKRNPLTDRARELALAELQRLRDGGYDPRAVIDRSVLCGWLTFYPLDKKPINGKSFDGGIE